jgi:hypothetical protein
MAGVTPPIPLCIRGLLRDLTRWGGKKFSFAFTSIYGTQKELEVPTEQEAEWTLREKLQAMC